MRAEERRLRALDDLEREDHLRAERVRRDIEEAVLRKNNEELVAQEYARQEALRFAELTAMHAADVLSRGCEKVYRYEN